jgi:hypothetical protein
MQKLIFAASIVGLFICSTAEAQPYYGRWGRGYGGYHASTIGESHANGVSNIIRSRARANLLNSEAAINYTEVRSRQLDNRLKTASTYFDMRRVNKEARFGTPEEKAAKRAYNQEKYFRYSQAGSPDRPTAQQLDPITGKINWPFSLMPEQYAQYREALQDIFAQRAKHGGYLTYDEYTKIQQATDGMLAALKQDIKKIPASDYISGKKFVEALVYEARHGNT